jgi:hypothetical protein
MVASSLGSVTQGKLRSTMWRPHKIRNEAAARAYSVGLDKLKAWAPNCNSDQMEDEADRLLQAGCGVALI